MTVEGAKPASLRTSRSAREGWYAGKGFGRHRRQRIQQEAPTGFNARMPYVDVELMRRERVRAALEQKKNGGRKED